MGKCPVCKKGTLRKEEIEETMFGVSLGTFQAEICDRCGESFVDEDTMLEIEAEAKRRGIWGLGQKITIGKSGNSLVVRIPARLARFMGIEAGNEALIHPEGEKKLIVEIT